MFHADPSKHEANQFLAASLSSIEALRLDAAVFIASLAARESLEISKCGKKKKIADSTINLSTNDKTST